MSEIKMNTVESLPILEEVPENATLLAVVDGEFYHIPGNMVGGDSGGKVFKLWYTAAATVDMSLDENETEVSSNGFTANMTYEELWRSIENAELIGAFKVSDYRQVGGGFYRENIGGIVCSVDNDGYIELQSWDTDPLFYLPDNTFSYDQPSSGDPV